MVRWLAIAAVFAMGPLSVEAQTTGYALGDPAAGEAVWRKCRACHQVGPDAQNKVGPILNDLIGRAPGTVEGYSYSPALEMAGQAGLTWSLENLDAYLADPKGFLQGTKMTFRGLDAASDRADVLAYLAEFSADAAAAPPPQAEVSAEILGIEGDAEYGAYLAGECTACHKAGGGAEGIPVITGLATEDFVRAMHAYKQQLRVHPVMNMVTGRLTNEEIAALAAYFAGQGN